MAQSQLNAMNVSTFPLWALLGTLVVVQSAPSNIVTQEEVYREAVTDGYIIDNFYLNSFTTESPKTPRAAEASQQLSSEETDITEASGDDDVAETSVVLHYGGESTTKSAWSTQQPSLESKVNDLLEGTEDTTNTAVFHHHGGEHHVSTTTGVPPAWSTQQSKESDLLEGSGDTTDIPVFLQDGNNNDISTGVSPAGGTEQPSIESKENDLLEATGDTNDTVVSLHHGGEHYEPATSTFLPVWNTQQPQENDLLEGSGDTTDVYVFLQNGSERDITTAMTAPPAWTRQQPPSVSEGSDSANESGHSTDPPIVPHHGRKHDVSATASVTQARSPSADVLPGDTDDSGSGDIWSSDGEIIHSTTSPSTSVSYTEMSTLPSTIHTEKRDEASQQLKNSNYLNIASVQSVQEPRKENPTSLPSVGHQTPGWIIILAFIVGVAAVVMVCIAIATRDRWNAPSTALGPSSESKMKDINQQEDVEMETFLHKDQPRENGRVTEYTVIPLDELPEKYSSD